MSRRQRNLDKPNASQYIILNCARFEALSYYRTGTGYGYVNPYESGTVQHELYLQGWESAQEIVAEERQQAWQTRAARC